jgi:hypothetical protein
MTKTAKKTRAAKAAFDTNEGPGLRRLRASKNGEAIRSDVLADQKRARRAARPRIKATAANAAPAPLAPSAAQECPPPAPAPDAPATPASPPTAAVPPRTARPMPRFQRGVDIDPTPIPTPAPKMDGMSTKAAAAFMAAARGELPVPPDFSKPTYAPDRKRLAELTALVEAGDAKALRAYAIKVYYSAALALDRYRQMAVIALEARAVE